MLYSLPKESERWEIGFGDMRENPRDSGYGVGLEYLTNQARVSVS